MSTIIRPLLPISDTADWLGVSRQTVRRLVASGLLPVVRVGGQLRFEPDAIEAYIAAHRDAVESTGAS